VPWQPTSFDLEDPARFCHVVVWVEGRQAASKAEGVCGEGDGLCGSPKVELRVDLAVVSRKQDKDEGSAFEVLGIPAEARQTTFYAWVRDSFEPPRLTVAR
jgi:hypothetical protein